MTVADQVVTFARKQLHLNVTPAPIPGSHIWACQTDVTPKMAADWLERLNFKNRNPRTKTIARYAGDMKSGFWLVTHQGIAFDSGGELIVGQHRLAAIVRSGKTVTFVIYLNCSPKERVVVDQTASRSIRDVALIGQGIKLRAEAVGMARVMSEGSQANHDAASPQSSLRFIKKHRAAIDFVLASIPRRIPGVTSATILGVLGRAYYSLTLEELAQVIKVLIGGFSTDNRDRPIILLRNHLLEHEAGRDRKRRAHTYGMAEAAISAFWSTEEITKLKPAEEELFSLPEEG